MEIRNYSNYYVLHSHELVDSFFRVDITDGLKGSFIKLGQRFMLHELFFEKAKFPLLDDVTEYWISHHYRLLPYEEVYSLPVTKDCFLHITKEKPLPLLYHFISCSFSAPDQIKSLFESYAEKDYIEEEYIQFYQYFIDYYSDNNLVLGQIFQDYEDSVEAQSFLMKAEEYYQKSLNSQN